MKLSKNKGIDLINFKDIKVKKKKKDCYWFSQGFYCRKFRKDFDCSGCDFYLNKEKADWIIENSDF